MRYAWTWLIKEVHLDEYVRMHQEPWVEVLTEHKNAGIRNYSIFQNGNQFFYSFECDDAGKVFEHLAKSEICKKWDAITSKMVVGSFNYDLSTPEFLREVFYLE
jgi:L-rhamnose mutarotase